MPTFLAYLIGAMVLAASAIQVTGHVTSNVHAAAAAAHAHAEKPVARTPAPPEIAPRP
jgi:hypothetical protein